MTTGDAPMTTPDDKPAAPAAELPSWHGPVTDLTGRVTKLEVAAVATNAKLDAIEKKTDAQTVMLGEIKGSLIGVARNPKVQVVFTLLFMAFTAWMAKHGFRLEVSP